MSELVGCVSLQDSRKKRQSIGMNFIHCYYGWEGHNNRVYRVEVLLILGPLVRWHDFDTSDCEALRHSFFNTYGPQNET